MNKRTSVFLFALDTTGVIKEQSVYNFGCVLKNCSNAFSGIVERTQLGVHNNESIHSSAPIRDKMDPHHTSTCRINKSSTIFHSIGSVMHHACMQKQLPGVCIFRFVFFIHAPYPIAFRGSVFVALLILLPDDE